MKFEKIQMQNNKTSEISLEWIMSISSTSNDIVYPRIWVWYVWNDFCFELEFQQKRFERFFANFEIVQIDLELILTEPSICRCNSLLAKMKNKKKKKFKGNVQKKKCLNQFILTYVIVSTHQCSITLTFVVCKKRSQNEFNVLQK